MVFETEFLVYIFPHLSSLSGEECGKARAHGVFIERKINYE